MTVVAIVPAKDRADTVGATVAGLLDVDGMDAVVVVDDGSRDGTADAAASAGATVVRLPVNVGKGAAIAAGIEAAPDGDVYLLIDADIAGTAVLAGLLLAPVLDGRADMTIAVLPSAGRKGGFGNVRRLAASGIARATHGRFVARAPLSGQRAVRGSLLRSIDPAYRFGLETAMTIDAVASGATVLEVDVPMDHRHTGRRLAGFRHRAGQGIDVVRALWPRLTTARTRTALIVSVFVIASGLALGVASGTEPESVAATTGADRVVVFGFNRLSIDDLEANADALPNLTRLRTEGALAAASVRTQSGRPTSAEAYASLGAGTRVKADDLAGFAFDATARLEGGTAA